MTQPIDPTLPIPIPEHGIAQVFRSISRVQVTWWNTPQKELGLTGAEKAWIKLTLVGSYRAIGIDEYRTGTNPNTGLLNARVSGNRVFTVSCRAESLDKYLRAMDLLERVRIGIRSISAAQAIRDLGLAFVRTHPITNLAMTVDGRVVRCAVMDIEFAMAQNVTPPDDGGVIEKVDGSSQAPGTPPTIPGTFT